MRIGALYLPVAAALLARAIGGRRPKLFAASLLSLLWTATSLLALQRLNQLAHWWTFSSGSPLLRKMPLELYLGWVVLWGILPPLLFPRLAIPWAAACMLAIDLVLMPLSKPLVVLNPHWLLGEAFAVLLCLLPALCLARWTLDDSHLRLRSALQILLSGLLFLFFLPELAFALKPGNGWQPLLQLAGWQRQIALQIIFLLSVTGISAVFEFADRGAGTPIPYDPPKRLVTSGIYRYCANPMQLSCIVVMLAWAALLRNGWFLLACAIALAYSYGLAEWDERQDLSRRFGDA